MYSVNWNYLLGWLLWYCLNTPLVFAFFSALLSPLKGLHSRFLLFVSITLLDVHTNGQVIKLEYALNQVFGAGITIHDAIQTDTLYIYVESENHPVYLPTYITGSGYDFEVWIPSAYKGQELFIRAFLNKYKLVTKKYTIIWI
ncbi:MAG: Flavobacterium phage vB FspM pippi8 [Bacteroidota bacterium]|jgi:ribosomal protein L31